MAYHGIHFSTISAGAWGFAALFVVQGLLFVKAGVLRQLEQAGTEDGVSVRLLTATEGAVW